MKKKFATVLIVSLMALPINSGLVFADETKPATNQTQTLGVAPSTTAPVADVIDSKGNSVDPGVLPDSPLYWFSTLLDKLQVALTSNPAKKAELTQEQALEKLAEANALAKKGKEKEAQKAFEDYSAKLGAAQAFIEQVKDPNSEVAKKLEIALAQVNAKNIQALGGLLDKLPPQAAQKVSLNIVRSMEKALEKQAKAEEKAAKVEETEVAKELDAKLKEFKKGLEGKVGKTNEVKEPSDKAKDPEGVKNQAAVEKEKGQQGELKRSENSKVPADKSVKLSDEGKNKKN
jgi:hypothetical protein